jgi:hypothetical protein
MLEVISRAAFERDVGRLDRRTAGKFGWKVVTAEFPILDVIFEHASAAPLRLRLTCDDWDELPPSIAILDATGNHLASPPPNVGSVFHPGPHRHTGRPFVCMRGAREFHTHESHETDHWSNYRGKSGMDLLGILSQLWRAWKRAVR